MAIIGAGLDARLGLPFDQLRAAAREAARLGLAPVQAALSALTPALIRAATPDAPAAS